MKYYGSYLGRDYTYSSETKKLPREVTFETIHRIYIIRTGGIFLEEKVKGIHGRGE